MTVNRPEEAWEYNARAVAVRPNDALAHSQMGLNEYELGDMDRAARELERACAIDPSHFSHPQLLLAEIYRRRGESQAAAEALEDFLQRHPDWPQADKLCQEIAGLRQ